MKDDKQHQSKDPNLDIPAEASRTKHVNFLDEDESRTGTNDDFASERRKQWQQGLEEGELARRAHE